MRPRVTLVNPPYPINPHKHMPFPQLGLGYLAAVLLENGYEVDVIDCQALYLHYDEYKKEISKRKPDLVGFTSITLTYFYSLIFHCLNQPHLRRWPISKKYFPYNIFVLYRSPHPRVAGVISVITHHKKRVFWYYYYPSIGKCSGSSYYRIW